jgi:TIR domain
MTEFRDRAVPLVRTARQIAHLRGATEEAAVLAQSAASLIETGYDNWNGGTTFYTLTLEVPIPLYAEIEDRRAAVEKSIHQRMSDLTRSEGGTSITEVVISPQLASEADPGREATDVDRTSPPGFWAPGHFRLFVSHVAIAKKGAHAIKQALADYQVAAFVAHDDIEPTKEWQGEIESALRTMDALTAIITPEFVSSRWCDQEVGIAMGRGKLVVPLRAGADPHGFMGKYQGVPVEKASADDIARRLFEVLVSHDQSHARMADALIERLANANAWEMSKKTISLLEQSPRLNRDQVARLVRTMQENSQVKDAFGVPSRIRSLVGRIGQPDAP